MRFYLCFCTSCGTFPVRPLAWQQTVPKGYMPYSLPRFWVVNLSQGFPLATKRSPRVYLWALPSIPAYKGRDTGSGVIFVFPTPLRPAPPMITCQSQSKVKNQSILSPRCVYSLCPPSRSGTIELHNRVSFCFLFFKANRSDEGRRGQKCAKSPSRTGQHA